MPRVIFKPSGNVSEVPENTKILVAANRIKQDIEFGCASCRCGTCGVRIRGSLSPMKANEKDLLEKMHLSLDGTIRLACQARVLDSDVEVDLDFQREYSPDQGS
ncbi:2Fe-2S iron-sulfur cluster-binding protein [Pseudobacteriovorax antillogorgiicola]|uniref:Ferredoxin n=1 Tax=Pseudobacteriovorax antillogorgiicola TaxID=1513793 RepID=A0A1Y6C551_9BACT|nr:2Fe-2S iron-sulfur cluster-binding protein [Pseudobacteriovorax antillogorgiicola]TCS49465.1 ferredoxin [Pseudobacteriovorax antillogorgiicola]SMF46301.1 Ferredoxin [Pseudobacteriovorax antillogorgiicola]